MRKKVTFTSRRQFFAYLKTVEDTDEELLEELGATILDWLGAIPARDARSIIHDAEEEEEPTLCSQCENPAAPDYMHDGEHYCGICHTARVEAAAERAKKKTSKKKTSKKKTSKKKAKKEPPPDPEPEPEDDDLDDPSSEDWPE